MPKSCIAVLFGGRSSEYEVSLSSAVSILSHIPSDQFDVLKIGITRQGRWLLYPGPAEKIANDQWQNHPDCTPVALLLNPANPGFLEYLPNSQFHLHSIACALPVLHGKNGEDGTIQGLLELSGIPYVGCNTLSSAICMDKSLTHILLEENGIRTARWMTLSQSDKDPSEGRLQAIISSLGLPLFIKPSNSGSSVGISRAHDLASLQKGIALAFRHDDKIVIEEGIDGAEIECAVLGENSPKASVLGQIIPCNEFYDYQAKYKGDSKLVIPAPLSKEVTEQAQRIALTAFHTLGCRGLARVDFFVTEDRQIILNEINTMPGFTNISMYPKLWEASGVPYSSLILSLIQIATRKK